MILFVESPGSKGRRIGTVLALLMLLLSLLFLMNDYRLSEPAPEAMPREKSWARSGFMPDVMVSGIEVEPLLPVKGEPFALNVFCQNIGMVSAGFYRIDVAVTDEGGNEVFAGSAYRKKMLDPGETDAAFSASITLNTTGKYTISVALNPEDFEDNNLENNRSAKLIDTR